MKKLFLGVFVAVAAITASAFTTALAPVGTTFGNDGSANYTLQSIPYSSSSDCLSGVTSVCAYRVTLLGQSQTYGTTLTPAQISTGIAQGYLEATGVGTYNPL